MNAAVGATSLTTRKSMYCWLVGARGLNLRGVCSEEVEGGEEAVVGKGGFKRTGTASPGRTHCRTLRSHSWAGKVFLGRPGKRPLW